MIPLAAPTLGNAELERIATVFERGQLTRGPEVEAFETDFATFCDVHYAIATANGTTALHTVFHDDTCRSGEHTLVRKEVGMNVDYTGLPLPERRGGESGQHVR